MGYLNKIHKKRKDKLRKEGYVFAEDINYEEEMREPTAQVFYLPWNHPKDKNNTKIPDNNKVN
jgi:hypothetical protein